MTLAALANEAGPDVEQHRTVSSVDETVAQIQQQCGKNDQLKAILLTERAILVGRTLVEGNGANDHGTDCSRGDDAKVRSAVDLTEVRKNLEGAIKLLRAYQKKEENLLALQRSHRDSIVAGDVVPPPPVVLRRHENMVEVQATAWTRGDQVRPRRLLPTHIPEHPFA